MGAAFSYTWSPDEMALRAKLAGLAHAATRLGADISAPARRRRTQRYEEQARQNFTAAYAAKRARNPRFSMSASEQEREIERMRMALVKLHMTELAHRPRTRRAPSTPSTAISTTDSSDTGAKTTKKDRLALGSYETARGPATPQSWCGYRPTSRSTATR